MYDGVKNGVFEASINAAILLENSHRFDENPAFGELLKRLWKGEIKKDDIEWINTRLVGKNEVTLPENTNADTDTCYACPFNKQRNATSAGIFQEHLQSDMFPNVDSNNLPPSHTIIIEVEIYSSNTNANNENTRVSKALTDRIINTCGDSHCISDQRKKLVRV